MEANSIGCSNVQSNDLLLKQELLTDLANAVRSLLEQQIKNPQPSKIWGVYSGMAKILELTELILKDGCTKLDYRGRVECRSFVLEASGSSGVGMFGSCSIVGWVQLHLANQRLSIKLRELYSDKDRLNEFYRKDSISVNAELRQSFLLIIEALEHVDVNRLDALIAENVSTEIVAAEDEAKENIHSLKDGQLVRKEKCEIKKTHRRSVSCPMIQEGNTLTISNFDDLPRIDVTDFPQGDNIINDKDIHQTNTANSLLKDLMKIETSDDVTNTLIHTNEDQFIEKVSSTTADIPRTRYKDELKPPRGHRRGGSDSGVRYLRSPEPSTYHNQRQEELNSSQEIKGTWSEVMPAKLGSYHRPKANQSLVSFLSETGLSSNRKGKSAQLDRENAHFVLSEAMIGTLEHLSFDSSMKSIDEGEESDHEIRELKKKLSYKNRQKTGETEGAIPKTNSRGRPSAPGSRRLPRRPAEGRRPLLSDARTDTCTTDHSASTDYNSESCLSGEELDKILDSNDEEYSMFEPGSKAFLKDIPIGSAESIALSLLGQIGAGRLPPADQIAWLVSEADAPQQLLPLPDSLPVDPDQDMKGATELRGNLVWAPPRPQLVLTVQEKPANRKAAMFQQKWQCTGCALRVEQKYSKSFRFCNYLGKYFCTGCHENQLAIIPSRVIQNWDFKKYYVSNFSMEILKSVFTERLFNMLDLNPNLLRKVEKLKSVVKCRIQLNKLNKYISTCRFSKDILVQIEPYLCNDPHLFSIKELFDAKFQKLGLTLRTIIGEGLRHVKSCQLCQARAFICEGCHSDDTIFPFQVGVFECMSCFSCYHRTCFKPEVDTCSKCKRLKERQEKKNERDTSEDLEI